MPHGDLKVQCQALLDESAFVRDFGFVIESLADGACTLFVAYKDAFERPGGVVSGPTYVAAADVAAWLAIKTELGLHDESVTADMTAQFIRGIRRAPFRCTARVLRLGGRLVFVAAECNDEAGDIVANFAITYIRAPAKR